MNTLSQKFAFAQYYAMPLPGSLSVRNGLNPVSREQIEKRARMIGVHPYGIFVNEVGARIKTFLKDNREYPEVSKIIDIDGVEQVYGKLYFSCTTENAEKLIASLKPMFEDMSFLPVLEKINQPRKLTANRVLALNI